MSSGIDDETWAEVTGETPKNKTAEEKEKEKKSEKVEQPVETEKSQSEEETSPDDVEPSSEEAPPVEASVETDIWGREIQELPEIPETPKIPVEVPSEEKKETPPAIKPPEPVFPEEIGEAKKIKYDTSPDRGSPKTVHTIYGLKGEGKTGLALSFPGKIAAISFDHKTVQVWEEMYNRDARIIVFDAIRYLDKSSGEMWLKTSDETLKYVEVLLDGEIAKFEPDWILIDGTEILSQICEMVMRFRNGLQPFQGISNRNVWKERRMLLDQVHNKCASLVKKGIIYTTYTDKDRVVKDGEFVTVKDVPKWIDAVMYFTDVVIRVKSEIGKDGVCRFTAIVESSKTKHIPTGKVIDITNGGYKTIVGD